MWKKAKTTPWNKKNTVIREVQKELDNQEIQISNKAISKAYGETHRLKMYYGELPGTDAYEEVLKFLLTKKRFESQHWYPLSLKMALKRVKDRRFINDKGGVDTIKNIQDVHQVLRELFASAGIKNGKSVQEIISNQLRNIA